MARARRQARTSAGLRRAGGSADAAWPAARTRRARGAGRPARGAGQGPACGGLGRADGRSREREQRDEGDERREREKTEEPQWAAVAGKIPGGRAQCIGS
jgi:hypothetical protein